MDAWAIIVGINLHPDLVLEELHGAVADSADFAEWCLDPKGGAVAPERMFYWSHPAPTPLELAGLPLLTSYLSKPTAWPHPRIPGLKREPEMAKRAPKSGEIVGLVKHMAESVAFGGPPRRVYVHFAGHGVQFLKEGEEDTCFMVGDYVDGQGLVPCKQMSAALQTHGFAEVVLFLDCCRSTVRTFDPLPTLFGMGAKARSHSGVGSAAEPGAPSFEYPEEPPKRGAFTTALTQGLRGQRGAGGTLTFDELGEYVARQAPLLAKKPQAPQFAQDPPNRPLVLVAGGADLQLRTVTVEFPPAQHGMTFIVFEADPAPPPIVAGPGAHRFQVPVGRAYALVNADRSVIRSFGAGDSHVP